MWAYSGDKMTLYDYISQTVGIIAMLFNILSYQQKTSKGVIIMQLFGGALFSINFFMLGATVGGILNIIAVFRAVVFWGKEKFCADSKAWLVVFIGLFITSYILTFTVFGKTFTLTSAVLELLPVIAMTATTVSFRINTASVIRKFGLISSPSWLIYNICNFALGAIICEAVSLVSIFIGMIRFDIKKSKN